MIYEGVPMRGFVTTDRWVKVEPSVEPVTLEKVKAFIKVDGLAEDSFLEQCIKAARKSIEGILGRSLITQTIILRLDDWPERTLTLPRPPLQSVVEVRTIDLSGNITVYPASKYYILSGDRSQLVISWGGTPPMNMLRQEGGYEVEYVAGYGSSRNHVPEPIRLAIMQWVATVYETRVPDFNEVPSMVISGLGISPYKRIRI